MDDEIRKVLRSVGGLSVHVDGLKEDTDLFLAGLSSLATVNVMLALEHRFSIEIPDELLTRRTFQTLGSLKKTVKALRAEVAPA